MKKISYLLSTALASAILIGMASFQPADAEEEYVSKAQVKTLYKAPLQGVAGKEVVVKHFSTSSQVCWGQA